MGGKSNIKSSIHPNSSMGSECALGTHRHLTWILRVLVWYVSDRFENILSHVPSGAFLGSKVPSGAFLRVLFYPDFSFSADHTHNNNVSNHHPQSSIQGRFETVSYPVSRHRPC